MPRKKIIRNLTPEDGFDNMVVEAIWNTTIEMRESIARKFERGDVSELIKEIPGVTREALLVASLVDAESRLVFVGNRLRTKRLLHLLTPLSKLRHFKATLDRTRILKSYAQTAHRSVDKTNKTVDNSALSVDKSVEKVVEKKAPSVDNFSTIYAFPQVSPDLSPACGEVVSLSTGPVDNFNPGLQSEQPLFKDSCPDVIPAGLSTQSTMPTTTTISTHI